MKTDKKTDRICYIAGWCILAVIALIAIFLKTADISLTEWIRPCLFHRVTGFYCPGCGGTRAVAALIHGRFLQALWYHPLVPYGAVLFGGFMLTQAMKRMGIRGIKGWKYHNWYLYGAVALILVNFLVKNGLRLGWGILM